MRRSRVSMAVLGLGGMILACEGDAAPQAGALMLAIQTDLAAPKDIAALGLSITSDGRTIFGDTRDVAPNGNVTFPASLAVLGDPNRPGAVIKIRVVAFKEDGDVRVLRDIITTIPKDRTALLRAPLLWINEGSGSGKRQELVSSLKPADAFTDVIKSACPDGQTYLEGECGDATVDSSTLPDYRDSDVFGGGDPKGNGGRCFDVLGCFAGATDVVVDPATCSAAIDPNAGNLSFAVLLPAASGTGECKDGSCLVPLDKGLGWKPDGGSVSFARALCGRIGEGKALGIVRTTACPTKDLATPSCGPASAVTTSPPPTGDGGALPVASNDFEQPGVFPGQPNLSAVAVDATDVYVARPSGVARIARADVLAQAVSAPAAALFGYGAPQSSAMLVRNRKIVVRGNQSDVRVCTPTSSDDCPTFAVNGAPTLAIGPTEAYVYGDTGAEPGLFAIDLTTPALVPRAVVPGIPVASMVHATGTLYLGMADGSISSCALPCLDAGSLSPLRAAPVGPAIVTAMAVDDRVPGKLFFMQVPADGVTLAAGGVFEIGTSGTGELALATGAEVMGAAPPPLVPPAALAVDSEYVYWGGSLAGGAKRGLLRKNHLTRRATETFVETAQGSEFVSSIAVDGSHVFWTYDRTERALVFAKKKRTF